MSKRYNIGYRSLRFWGMDNGYSYHPSMSGWNCHMLALGPIYITWFWNTP